MNNLLEQLHDIEGVDPISWWPLAVGWWVLIALGVCLAVALGCFVVYRLAFVRSWKNDTLKKLAKLQDNLSETTAQETVVLLSEYLRRIAIRRFSRKECAALMGEAWLKWLTLKDPKQFDWEKQGTLLIEVPYAPVNRSLSLSATHQIKDLIHAVKQWIN
ncbi:MAG: DUF4381 domain-containing protein [Parachlamydiaceae bacterium]